MTHLPPNDDTDSAVPPAPEPAALPHQPLPTAATMRAFYQVLANTLVANVTTSYLWFALTFWAYLETKNVMATAIIGGSYMLLVAIFGVIFGAIVDHLKKKIVTVISSVVTLVTYLAAGALYLAFDESVLINWGGPWFWVFAGVILIGGVVENLRNIALSTTVTLLVPAERRPNANGLVGTVQGVAFLVTSVFSGLSIGLLGMGPTVFIAIIATAIALMHLVFVKIPERGIAKDPNATSSGLSFRAIIPAVRAVPGLFALILFATFNNLVGGVFMALMDPYGLTLFSVEMWGVVLGVTGTGFILGGILIAKFGLGKNPLRTLLLANVGVAVLGMTFAIRELWWIYALGIFLFMCIMPVAEAAEQTVIQRVVPYEKQGRVFGFAASLESAAAPITAFLIGPIAQFWLIPYMETDAGRAAFGWLLGEGEARGMALVFVLASLIMLVVVLFAFVSRPYHRLSAAYAEAPVPDGGDGEPAARVPAAGDAEPGADPGAPAGGAPASFAGAPAASGAELPVAEAPER